MPATPATAVPTPYRRRARLLLAAALLVLLASFWLLFQAVQPGNTRHLPAILWIVLEFVALGLFGAGLWQRKKHHRAQPGYAPNAD